jgi:hypothetical protein
MIYKFNVICTFYNSDNSPYSDQNIFDIGVTSFSQASVIAGVFRKIAIAKLAGLEKISLALDTTNVDETEIPNWFNSSQGKIFFATKDSDNQFNR